MNSRIQFISILVSCLLISTLVRAELVFQINKANSYQVDSFHTIQPNIQLKVGHGEIFDVERYLTINLSSELFCSIDHHDSSLNFGNSQGFLNHVNITSKPITISAKTPTQCKLKWFTSIYDTHKPEYLFFIGQSPETLNFGKLSNPQEFVELTPPLISIITLTNDINTSKVSVQKGDN